jgi:uncharacterized lipoprotein YddW (UPF0748 family)
MLMGARAQELPRPPAGGRVFPEWQALRDDAAVRKMLLPMEGTPLAVWDAAGYVRLPVNFKGTSHARASWDVRIKVDLRGSRGIQFDFYCRELEPFAAFSLYFRSGGGWYHAWFCPDRVGMWQRIEIDKADTYVEGTPAGWGQVDAIRVSGWRGRDQDTLCAIANLGFTGGAPQVLVVRADSNVVGSGEECRGLGRYARTVSSTFDQMGIDSVQVADTDLAPELFAGIKLVVLPYNPRVPAAAAEHLRAYVEGGGKLLVCYSLPAEIGKLLGLRATGSALAKPANYMGFARTAQGLSAQPDFVQQASWRTTLAAPLEGQAARVLAVWRDGQGNDTPHPALTLTPTGVFMGHVWFGSGVEALALMRAVAGEMVPDIWQKSAERALARVGAIGDAADFAAFRAEVEAMRPSQAVRDALAKSVAARDEAAKHLAAKRWHESLKASGEAEAAARRAWFLTRKPRASEHRAFWCHSAFGLPGKNWDDSIRFLKENGFTAIQPNMLWGGIAYYPSKVLPVYEALAERGDQVEQCVTACRKYGVACHVWKVNWNMSSRAPKGFVERMVREGRVQKLFNGEVKDNWLCPSHPENQNLEVASMVELVRMYKVDGVHFDYIRYPDGDSCFCDGCRARFEAKLGRRVAQWPQDTRKDEEIQSAWLDFRRAGIDTVVRRVAQEARAIRPSVQISAAVFRNLQLDRDNVGQDWGMWCAQGWLDFVCPMDYIESNVAFRNVVSMQKAFVGKVPLYPGIGLSCWKDPKDAVKLAEQIEVTRELGLSGFTVFDYDANAEAVLPWLRLGTTAE